MDRLLVTGGARLAGTVTVSGAKNSALKLMAASILAPDRSVITNVPRIRDCAVMAEMLEHLGVSVRLGDGVAELDATTVADIDAPHELVSQIRASIVLLGPLLARCGRARVALPGGDKIGARPVDLHVRGLERMGAAFRSEHGYLVAEASNLHGASITLDYPSVTATENLLLAGVLARGTTVIDNAAREPEIADLALFLTSMGAMIDGAGSSTIEIQGVDGLRGGEHTAVPDRIEAGTWAAAAVATLGDVTITNARPEHLELLLAKLADAGATIETGERGLRVHQPMRARAMDLVTLPYPGIATDFQPILLAMLSVADGTSIVTENVFEARFLYVGELQRMGADIRTQGHHAVIRGVPQLSAAPVRSLDIRAAMALVIAALCADGVTEITEVHHIDRGYEDLEGKLVALGAEIRRDGGAVIPEPPGPPSGGEVPPPPAAVIPPPPGITAATGSGPKGLPAVPWQWWEALLIGLVTNLILAQTVVGLIAFLALGVTSENDPKTVYVGIIVDLAWLLFMLLWLTQRHRGWQLALGVTNLADHARDAAWGFVAGLILYPVIAIAVGLPLTILFSALSGEEASTPDQLPQHLTGGTAVASVILAVLVAPVVEETYFRGILFRSIRDRHGFWPGALVSGVVFGLAHFVPSPWQDAVLLQSIMVFTGIALAWIHDRRATLVANVAAHMAFNAVGIFLILRFA